MTVCICGRDVAPESGDQVELGVTLGAGCEPAERWGRLVGIRHHKTGMQKYVIREFVPGDKAFPTGKYVTTWLIVPWAHKHPQDHP
jgi:hypothetical protein